MCRGLIGRKLGMTSLFMPNGNNIPVTVVQVGPCRVTQIKRRDKEGYDALQLAFEEKKKTRLSRPLAGHLEKTSRKGCSILREFPIENPDDYKLGQEIDANLFSIGDKVDVTGVSKGRGFSGVVKRHGFHGGKKTHGSHSHRIPGSIGCSADPARVIKGKKMPGQYGNATHTARNLTVMDIRPEKNLVMVKGAVPGASNGLVTLNMQKTGLK